MSLIQSSYMSLSINSDSSFEDVSKVDNTKEIEGLEEQVKNGSSNILPEGENNLYSSQLKAVEL